MTVQDLVEQLKDRRKASGEALAEQKRAWLEAVEKLYLDVESWLAPGITAGVLQTARSETSVMEPDLGPYDAPVLEITDGRVTIRLTPEGSHVVGHVAEGGRRLTGLRGRVDLLCGPIRVPLVRTALDTWQAVTTHGGVRDLTEEIFSEILSDILLDE